MNCWLEESVLNPSLGFNNPVDSSAVDRSHSFLLSVAGFYHFSVFGCFFFSVPGAGAEGQDGRVEAVDSRAGAVQD